MAADDLETTEPRDKEHGQPADEPTVPIGIARIRQEWRAAGLDEDQTTETQQPPIEPVVFSEVEGGAGIGDYTLDPETVKAVLAVSAKAFDRLISSGEIDSILVRGPDGVARRLISESSVTRFEADSAIDPEAIERAAKALADQGLAEAIGLLRSEIDELRNTQAKILQQMKDMLLLEVRNLKEQDRDLTSFVYELAEEIRGMMPRKRRK